jgi:hypothetical protein
MKYPLIIFLLVLFTGCSKEDISTAPRIADGFTEYIISTGDHYCNRSAVTPVSLASMNFIVKFDSSAVYATTDPVNQFDINKLMGFTEGSDPHLNSARIGWSFNNNALRLYAYVYNNGERISEEICSAPLNEEIDCFISIAADKYIFNVNDSQVHLSRINNSSTANGYLLYPYFGGDETAPADISIFIKGPELH